MGPLVLTTDMGGEFVCQSADELYGRLGFASRLRAPEAHVDRVESVNRRPCRSFRYAILTGNVPPSLWGGGVRVGDRRAQLQRGRRARSVRTCIFSGRDQVSRRSRHSTRPRSPSIPTTRPGASTRDRCYRATLDQRGSTGSVRFACTLVAPCASYTRGVSSQHPTPRLIRRRSA